jgi:hypothetical protein
MYFNTSSDRGRIFRLVLRIPTKIVYACLVDLIHATCVAYLVTALILVTARIMHLPIVQFLSPTDNFPLFGSNILSSNVFLGSPILRDPIEVEDKA